MIFLSWLYASFLFVFLFVGSIPAFASALPKTSPGSFADKVREAVIMTYTVIGAVLLGMWLWGNL